MTTPIAAANCTVHLPDGSKHENMIVESNRGQLRVKRRNGEIVFESSASAVRFGERPMSLEIDVPKRDERGELLIGEKATVLVLRGGGCGCGGSR